MNILITGATKGIGKAIALKMGALGHNLAICARSESDLLTLANTIKDINSSVKVYTKKVDCGVKEEIIAFANEVMLEFDFIDVLVNNVGVFIPSLILEEEDNSLLTHLNTNLLSAYYLYKIIGKSMRNAQKGHVFNVCSVASKESIANAGSYCVTKAALLSLNNIMREELKNHDVKVTAILPGSTLTDSWKGTTIAKEEFVQAEDVAELVSASLNMSKGANVDEILIKPLHGQI